MAIGLLINTFTGNINSGQSSLKRAVTSHGSKPAAKPLGKAPTTNTPKTVTTDNSQAAAQNKAIAKQSKNFSRTLDKKKTTKTAQKIQVSKKGQKQGKTSGTFPETFLLDRPFTVQEMLTRPVVLGKNIDVKKAVNGKVTKAHSPFIKIAKPITIKPDQMDSAISKPKNKLFNSEGVKEPLKKTLPGNGKTATVANKQSIVADKPFASGNSKTQLSNIPVAQYQPSHLRQEALTNLESQQAQVAEKTATNKSDTKRKGYPEKAELLKLLKKDGVGTKKLSAKPLMHKMSQKQVQFSALQAKNSNNLFSNQTFKSDIELAAQELAGNNAQSVIAKSPASSTAFAKTADNIDLGGGIREQIQESVHNSLRSGNQQIVIRLNPPELGKVAIKFQEQSDNITGLLQVDKPQTKEQIERALPEIIQNLQDSGIQVKKLEVVLTNQQGQYNSKEQSSTTAQDNWSGQQGLPNSESQRSNTASNEWLGDIDNAAESAQTQIQFTDNSINMLI